MRAQRGPFTVVVNAAPVRRARRRARDAGDPPAPRADAAAAAAAGPLDVPGPDPARRGARASARCATVRSCRYCAA